MSLLKEGAAADELDGWGFNRVNRGFVLIDLGDRLVLILSLNQYCGRRAAVRVLSLPCCGKRSSRKEIWAGLKELRPSIRLDKHVCD